MAGMEKVTVFREGQMPEGLDKQWDRIVDGSECGYYTQLYGWMEACSEAFGFEMYPLAKYRDGRLQSVFPLLYDRSSRELLSPPLAGIGGPTLVSDLPSYLKEIKSLAAELKAEAVRIRVMDNAEALTIFRDYNYNTDHILPFYMFDLSGFSSFDELRKSVYDKGSNSGWKRSIREGVEVVCSRLDTGAMEVAYEIYSEMMIPKKAGPLIPRDFFTHIAKRFGDHAVVFKAVRENKIIGTAVCFVVNRCMSCWLILGRTDARKFCVNNALYSHIIQYALSRKIPVLDFGPSGFFSRGREIKMRHGGRPKWVFTAAWFRNRFRGMNYGFRKRIKKFIITHPDSMLSRYYRRLFPMLYG